MFLVSLIGWLTAAGLLAAVLWEKFRVKDCERTAERLERELRQAREDREKWKNAAETARQKGIDEAMNVFRYTGSEVGQVEITD